MGWHRCFHSPAWMDSPTLPASAKAKHRRKKAAAFIWIKSIIPSLTGLLWLHFLWMSLTPLLILSNLPSVFDFLLASLFCFIFVIKHDICHCRNSVVTPSVCCPCSRLSPTACTGCRGEGIMMSAQCGVQSLENEYQTRKKAKMKANKDARNCLILLCKNNL